MCMLGFFFMYIGVGKAKDTGPTNTHTRFGVTDIWKKMIMEGKENIYAVYKLLNIR